MKPLRYLVLLVLAMSALAGCGGQQGPPPPTPVPFVRHNGQQVLDALANAGLSVQNAQRDRVVGRDAPVSFQDRYTFEIAEMAPRGGQVLVFDAPEDLAEWEQYIERLRGRSTTRRDVIYTYVHHNIMLQLTADLPPDRAQAYRDALLAME